MVWLLTIVWPLPPSADLDPSWQQVLVDAWLQGRRFGHDIVFTWGPLGFVFAQYVVPDALTAKLAFELAGRLALTGVLVALAWPLPALRGLIWVVALGVLGAGMVDAVVLVATAGLLGAWVLPEGRPIRTTLGLVLVGAAALVKITMFALALGGVVLMAIAAVADRRPARAAWIVAGWTLSVVGWWLLAGQSLQDIWPYLRWGYEIAAGYAPAMALEEPTPVLLAGIGILLAHACWIVPALWAERSNWARLPLVGLCVLVVFVAWKHGYTRGGGHAMHFFLASVLLATLLPAIGGATRWAELGGLVAVSVGVLAYEIAFPGLLQTHVSLARLRVVTAVQNLGAMGTVVEGFHRSAAEMPHIWLLPKTKETVGSASIDLIGFAQGILYINDLNYHPRPVPQSYTAYTPTLAEADREFMATERAPAFLLASLRAIDGRYPSQEDAALLVDLPRRYEPVFDERGYVLLSRRGVQPPAAPVGSDVVLDVTVGPGEPIDLPPHGSSAHLISIDARPSWQARLRALVFRPYLLHMTVTDDRGATFRSRLVPPIIEAGFLIQPTLVDQEDFAHWLKGEGRRWNSRLVLGTGPGEAEPWLEFRVRLSRLRMAPLGSASPP